MQRLRSFLLSTLINMLLRYEWIPIILITVVICWLIPFIPWWIVLIPLAGWFIHGLIATGFISLLFSLIEWANRKIDENKKINLITQTERSKLVYALKNFNFKLKSLRDFNEAIITKGGVSVKEINPSTMESKLVKGLYFAGEVIDADAYTGGFNLQIAFSTGRLAGLSAAEEE